MYTMYTNASNNTPSYIYGSSYMVRRVHPMGVPYIQTLYCGHYGEKGKNTYNKHYVGHNALLPQMEGFY